MRVHIWVHRSGNILIPSQLSVFILMDVMLVGKDGQNSLVRCGADVEHAMSLFSKK